MIKGHARLASTASHARPSVVAGRIGHVHYQCVPACCRCRGWREGWASCWGNTADSTPPTRILVLRSSSGTEQSTAEVPAVRPCCAGELLVLPVLRLVLELITCLHTLHRYVTPLFQQRDCGCHLVHTQHLIHMLRAVAVFECTVAAPCARNIHTSKQS